MWCVHCFTIHREHWCLCKENVHYIFLNSDCHDNSPSCILSTMTHQGDLQCEVLLQPANFGWVTSSEINKAWCTFSPPIRSIRISFIHWGSFVFGLSIISVEWISYSNALVSVSVLLQHYYYYYFFNHYTFSYFSKVFYFYFKVCFGSS